MAIGPKIGQGPWQPIDDPESIEAVRDEVGFTNPNLHRRTSGDIPEGTYYNVSIYGFNSYRFTSTIDHDEESTTSEIP